MRIDVLFIADFDVAEMYRDIPDNVKIHHMSLCSIRELATRKLGASVSLFDIRKLCDLRPFYGLIFEDFLSGYHYWGYGDADVIYGKKLNTVLSTIYDIGYDAVSFRKYHQSGGFSLFKNSDVMRNACKRITDWRLILNDSAHYCLDECGRAWFKLRDLAERRCTIDEIANEYGDSWTACLKRMQTITCFNEDVLCESPLRLGFIRYKNGRLSRFGREISLFHYIKIKASDKFSYSGIDKINTDDFRIDSCGFYDGSALIYRKVFWLEKNVYAFLKYIKSQGIVKTIKNLLQGIHRRLYNFIHVRWRS